MLGMGIAAGILLSACSLGTEQSQSSQSEAGNTLSSATSPSVNAVKLSEPIDHIHGLVAVSPDRVIAGTHSGAVSISASGQVSKSGNERDDLMGMTGEAGTESLVSSGHPGPGSSFRNPVGLIASSDGGSNWQSISLEGEVDYHALAVSEGTVIGYGGGKTLSVSADGGRTWSPGAAIQPAALALSSQRVLATTQAGLQVSTDTGQSFEVVAGAPRLVLISAGTGTNMLGLDDDRNAWTSDDSGASWSRVGPVGNAAAVASFDESVGYAVDEETLYIFK